MEINLIKSLEKSWDKKPKGRPVRNIKPNTKTESVHTNALVESVLERNSCMVLVKRGLQPVQVVDFYPSRK